MMIFNHILVLVVLTLGSVVSKATNGSTDGKTFEEKESCYQLCDKTYSLHTYPKSQHLTACQRGCRFSILSHLNLAKNSANSLITDPKLVTNNCIHYCSQAYDTNQNSSEYYACGVGCNNVHLSTGDNAINSHNNSPKVHFNTNDVDQVINEAISHEKSIIDNVDKNDNTNSNQMFISPINLFRSLFSSLVSRTSGPVVVERSSMSVFFSRDNDGQSKLVVVQSEPEVVVHQYPDLMAVNEYDSESVTGSEEHITTDNNRPKIDVSLWSQESPLNVVHSRHVDNSWSNCFPYESGVPRWILGTALFLAIFVLAWICCATTATAPEQHIRTRKIGQGSDLKYLCLYEEPVKVIIDDKLPTYEELEAQNELTVKTICSNDNKNIGDTKH
ncbi:transmembrane protein 59-like [Oppia nitens]|uniref:transmembrane protein 59-like n=1 Tax=Oppia nitens TaxID=1686743 RepID=UPI0023DCD4E4|nr:transmembrane protein 59-like [Oppia nitens]